MKDKVTQKYTKLHSLYSGTKNEAINKVLKEAENSILENRYDEADKLLSTLKTREQLIDKIMSYIHGKPVHKTLKRISEGKIKNPYEALTGLSSLFTHICIEAERGSTEYHGILRELNLKVGKLLNLEIDINEALK